MVCVAFSPVARQLRRSAGDAWCALARGAALWLVCLCFALALFGCSGCDSETPPDEALGAGGNPGWERAILLYDELPNCDISHHGLLIDMGTDATVGRFRHRLTPLDGIVSSERGGTSWARIYEKRIELTFHLPSVTRIFVALRGIGHDATRVAVSLDGYYLGSVKLARDADSIARTGLTDLPVDAGLHRLTLRFSGNKRTDSEPYAELDWVRIGTPGEEEGDVDYGAPTLDVVQAPAAHIAGVPHRGIALRAPGSVRCTLRVPPFGRLQTAVGIRGSGSATAAIVVHRDGHDPEVLERIEVEGDESGWRDVEVMLHPYAGEVVTVELVSARSKGTGRLMFGDPAILVPSASDVNVPEAQAAVIVVLGGVERSDLPGWREADTPHLPTLNQLAKRATVFHAHRTPSTLVATTMASLVTGLPPIAHGLSDRGARLADAIPNLGLWARQASVRAALFTGVPSTFDFFGFASHWETFEQFPPNSGALASAPLDGAAAWLSEPQDAEEARPMLAIVHTRGGHPPWEVTPPEAAKLPPAEYTGYLGPRRAAQILAKMEGRHSRMSDADRERMRALYHASLSRQDAALGQLIRSLDDAGRWDSTLFIVTADVSSARSTLFVAEPPLEEDVLTVPLYVHFPGGAHSGKRVETPTEIYDVSRTALTALGLKARASLLGRDLYAVASGHDDVQRIAVARADADYTARWGDFVLRGTIDEAPSLCLLEVDPTCAYDHSHRYPMTAQELFRRLARFQRSVKDVPERTPLELDSESAAMLEVWGTY